MKIRLIIYCFLFFISITALGQTDSLLKKARIDLEKEDYTNSLRAYLQAARIEEKKGNNSQLAAIYQEVAQTYLKGEIYEKALEYLEKSYKILPNDEILVKMADLESRLGRYANALVQYKKVEDNYVKKFADNPLLQAPVLRKIVLNYQKQSDYQSSLLYNQKILALQQEYGDTEGLIIAKNNIGYNYKYLKNYQMAIKSFSEVLSLEEKQAKNQTVNNNTTTLINLGITFQNVGDYEQSLDYLLRATKVIEKSQNKKEMAKIYDLLSSTYFNLKDYYNAQYYNNLAISTSEAAKDKGTLGSAYQTTSLLYQVEEKYDKALEFFKKYLEIKDSLLIIERFQQQELMQQQYVVERTDTELKLILASEEIKDAQLKEARAEAEKAEKENKILQQTQRLKDAQLTQQALEQKRAKQELLFLQQKAEAEKKDREILSLERKKALQEAELAKKSKLEKEQEARLELLNKDKKLQALALKEKQQQIARQQEFQQAVIGIGILGALIFLLILYGFIITRKKNGQLALQQKQISEKNAELEQQNAEIAAQRDVVSQQNTTILEINEDITASITYAQRIQQAILPLSEEINTHLTQNFILFKPRDIVSGDFYFFQVVEYTEKELNTSTEKRIITPQKKIIIAAVDCTGHGVPGAFMSMIGNKVLEETIIKDHITEADLILNSLHIGVRKALKQESSNSRDGMDLALLVLSYDANNRPIEIEFSGAKNPLIYIQNDQLYHIKGDKMPIGGEQREQTRIFTKHLVPLVFPTFLYLFTDGYQDQFGGTNRKKFGTKALKDILLAIHKEELSVQRDLLEKTITTWMSEGNELQIDDILVMGISV